MNQLIDFSLEHILAENAPTLAEIFVKDTIYFYICTRASIELDISNMQFILQILHCSNCVARQKIIAKQIKNFAERYIRPEN